MREYLYNPTLPLLPHKPNYILGPSIRPIHTLCTGLHVNFRDLSFSYTQLFRIPCRVIAKASAQVWTDERI